MILLPNADADADAVAFVYFIACGLSFGNNKKFQFVVCNYFSEDFLHEAQHINEVIFFF